MLPKSSQNGSKTGPQERLPFRPSFYPYLGPSWGAPGSILDALGHICGPSWGQEGPRWSQVGAKMGPRWGQERPRWAKMRPRGGQDGPRWGQDGPSWAILGLSWHHFGRPCKNKRKKTQKASKNGTMLDQLVDAKRILAAEK